LFGDLVVKRDASVAEAVRPDNKQVPVTYRYHAFISYSHDPRQSVIAEALQQAIQRFAKPFWRRRAVRLFRDQTNLSANPNLWGTIVEALRDSRFLILIASPKAARSSWVSREIEWWLSRRDTEAIIVVLTEGVLLWDGNRFSDGETTALPTIARTAFQVEPLWLDLTGIAADPTSSQWRRMDVSSTRLPASPPDCGASRRTICSVKTSGATDKPSRQ
jgi:hypothetical protein